MKYVIVIAVSFGLIAWHDAWGSIECPLLISLGALICVMLKVKSDEQRKKKESERSGNTAE